MSSPPGAKVSSSPSSCGAMFGRRGRAEHEKGPAAPDGGTAGPVNQAVALGASITSSRARISAVGIVTPSRSYESYMR